MRLMRFGNCRRYQEHNLRRKSRGAITNGSNNILSRVICNILALAANRERLSVTLTSMGGFRPLFGAINQKRSSVRVLTRLPPAAFTAYGLQSVTQHVAHFTMGTGTGC